MPQLGSIAATRRVQLRDGRALAFAEFGQPDGMPVFFMHDLPGTRLYRHPDQALTSSTGVRLITVDRPGLGQSDPHPGRTLLDWPDDIQALADVLHIERFAVLGHSAGGPYAAACAYKLSQRVTRAAIVAGFPPSAMLDDLASEGTSLRKCYRLAQKSPWLLKLGLRFCWWMISREHDYQGVIRKVLLPFPAPDQELFSQFSFIEMMEENVEELHYSGSAGCADDLRVLTHSWGFGPEELAVPVDLWWGEADSYLPVAVAHCLASVIPDNRMQVVPQAGHYVIFSHWQQILSALRQTATSAQEG